MELEISMTSEFTGSYWKSANLWQYHASKRMIVTAECMKVIFYLKITSVMVGFLIIAHYYNIVCPVIVNLIS